MVPDTVEVMGTIRALAMEQQDRLRAAIEDVARGAAAGCNVTIEWSPVPYIPTINDPELAEFAIGASPGTSGHPVSRLGACLAAFVCAMPTMAGLKGTQQPHTHARRVSS